MKILVFADIHGNLNALNAIMQTPDYLEADKKIFLGDVTFGCSRVEECIDILKTENIECLIGNNDSYISDHIPDCDWLEFQESKKEQFKWMIDNISQSNKDVINTWKKDLMLNINGIKFYLTHYPWENYNNDTNVIDTPKLINLDTRKQMFKDIDADYYIFGHEHKGNHFTDNQKHYICLGSSGLKPPRMYLVIDINEKIVKITEKNIDIDIEEELTLIDKAGYPYALNKIKG